MDPHLDGSHDIAAGLRLARTFLRDVWILSSHCQGYCSTPHAQYMPSSFLCPPSAPAPPSRKPTARLPGSLDDRSVSRMAPRLHRHADNASVAAAQPSYLLA